MLVWFRLRAGLISLGVLLNLSALCPGGRGTG
jgi:hypothetical protein